MGEHVLETTEQWNKTTHMSQRVKTQAKWKKGMKHRGECVTPHQQKIKTGWGNKTQPMREHTHTHKRQNEQQGKLGKHRNHHDFRRGQLDTKPLGPPRSEGDAGDDRDGALDGPTGQNWQVVSK